MNKLHFEITKSAVGAGSVALAASSVYLLLSQSISVAAFAVFCCIIGASVAKSCCTCFSSVLWMPAASVSCCYGAFLTAAWRGSALEYVGGALIGLSCGGFLFVIIPLAVANQFKHCIALASGIIWSLALVFSLLMLLISESSLYTALLTAAVCMLAGSLCIRIKPCNDAVRFFPMPQSRFKAAAASSFVVLISLSAALLSVLCSRNLFSIVNTRIF